MYAESWIFNYTQKRRSRRDANRKQAGRVAGLGVGDHFRGASETGSRTPEANAAGIRSPRDTLVADKTRVRESRRTVRSSAIRLQAASKDIYGKLDLLLTIIIRRDINIAGFVFDASHVEIRRRPL